MYVDKVNTKTTIQTWSDEVAVTHLIVLCSVCSIVQWCHCAQRNINCTPLATLLEQRGLRPGLLCGWIHAFALPQQRRKIVSLCKQVDTALNFQILSELEYTTSLFSPAICFGVQSIKHANVLSEKNHFSALGGSKFAIFGGDDLDPLFFEVHMFSDPPDPPLYV